jgi:hypothetical protein
MAFYWALTLTAFSKSQTVFLFRIIQTMTMKSRRKPSVKPRSFFLPFKTDHSSGRYQASMLRSLKEVQSDDSVVGFYQAITLGAFFDQTLVETQAIHQDKLRHGGVIIVHGLCTLTPPSRVLCGLTRVPPKRSFANGPRECTFPCVSFDKSVHGCLQEGQLQHLEVNFPITPQS